MNYVIFKALYIIRADDPAVTDTGTEKKTSTALLKAVTVHKPLVCRSAITHTGKIGFIPFTYADNCLDVLLLFVVYELCAAEEAMKDSFPEEESSSPVNGILG
jgi:hypothetical protein